MCEKIFTFDFDVSLADKLRQAINENQNTYIHMGNEHNKCHWNIICAILDRLTDTLEYLNTLQLGKIVRPRWSFDFYDFINNIYVVTYCIEKMIMILGMDKSKMEDIKESKDVFGNVLNADGSDGQFFDYIRSVTSVHPLNTDKDHPYLNGAKAHFCPFVTWNRLGNYDEFGDLYAVVYTSELSNNYIKIPLYIDQFKKYLQKWIDLINDIIQSIAKHNKSRIDKLKKEKLKSKDDFQNIIEYTKYLKDVYNQRCDNQIDDLFDKYIYIFSITPTNSQNVEKLQKYKNAIEYSLQFLHSRLQNMCFEGYENTGIIDNTHYGDDLFFELDILSCRDSVFKKYHYAISKLIYLTGNYDDEKRLYARYLLNEMIEELNKFVVFTNTESDEETIALVNLALYLEALDKPGVIGLNIPNDLRFREHTLSETQLEELRSKPNKDEHNDLEQLVIEIINAAKDK